MNSRGLKNLLGNEWLTLLTRLVLAAIFLYAAWDKFLHPRAFAIVIASYKILPSYLINLSAIFLPSLELVIGVALLLGLFPRGAVFIMTGLMLAFMAAFVIAMARGINLADCGCFSTTHPIEDSAKGTNYTYQFFFRDLGFLLLLLQNLIFGRHKFALQNLFSKI